jgi:hypothetical protein
MENNNLELLKENLKYLGFGNSLSAALEAKISQRLEQFKIGVSSEFDAIQKDGIVGRDKVNYELNFLKSPGSNLYFLDQLRVTLNDRIQNTFPFGKGNDVTAKEAYNLLRGASIHKKAILNRQMNTTIVAPGEIGQVKEGSGEKIESIWIKLDFEKLNEQGNYSYKKFYPDHGFNLESELKKYAIKELDSQQEKEALISSIGRGNAAKATLENGQSVIIEADPEAKKIKFYDSAFKELFVSPTPTQEIDR